MTDHTTIQVTAEQAAQLRELKQYDDEPYKSVIARLLDGYNSATGGDNSAIDDETLYAVRDEIIGAISAECGDVATLEDLHDVAERLSELDESVSEATAAAQRTERSVDDLTRTH